MLLIIVTTTEGTNKQTRDIYYSALLFVYRQARLNQHVYVRIHHVPGTAFIRTVGIWPCMLDAGCRWVSTIWSERNHVDDNINTSMQQTAGDNITHNSVYPIYIYLRVSTIIPVYPYLGFELTHRNKSTRMYEV